MKIVAVTLAIITASHAALGTNSVTVFFDQYPTTANIKDNVDGAFADLLDACEVEDVAAYSSDYQADDSFISFECHDQEGSHIGSIIIEAHDVNASSLVIV